MPIKCSNPWKKSPFSLFMATVAGVGCIRGAPGTYGSIVALVPIWLISSFPLWIRALCLMLAVLGACLWAHRAGLALGEHDSQQIVIDEIVGLWFALVLFEELTTSIAVFGLCVFRLFDIIKIWPARLIDNRIHNGIGVVGDDIVAGIWSIPIIWLFVIRTVA